MGGARRWAAGFLCAAFVWVTVVALAVEPAMGFSAPGDFLDPEKVAAGYRSAVWAVSSLVYIGIAAALLVLALPEDDRLLRLSAGAGAVLWLVLGSLDRVGLHLSALLGSHEAVVVAVAGLLPARLAILRSAVVALGVFGWRTTRVGAVAGAERGAWRAFGWALLALGLAFEFVFLPMPLVFSVWAGAMTLRWREAASGPGSMKGGNAS